MSENNITKEILEELYWKKELSLSQIAKNCSMKSPNGISYYMDKFKLTRRPSTRMDYPKKTFSGELDEKAYLIGLRAGDVYAGKHAKLIMVCTTSPKKAQMNMFREVFGKYSHVNEYPAKGGFTEKTLKINSYLHPSFDFLIQKPKSIPEWVLNDKKLFYSFLAGYCDSEASWIITEHKKYNGKWKDMVFSLGTCDKTILEQINQKLKEFGFSSHLYLARKKGVYGTRTANFDLYRVMMMKHNDVVKLAETLLPLSKHEEKKKAKLRIISFWKTNTERKILKRHNLGVVEISCPKCKHNKVWRNGFRKYKNSMHPRYKCPLCKKEFEERKTNANS